MKLCIIGAMRGEIVDLQRAMEHGETREYAGFSFTEGTIEGLGCVVVRSGIGKVNAALCTQIAINLFHVDAVVNTGVAGSLSAEININDLVIGTDCVQHDVECGSLDYPKGQIPELSTFAFAADDVLRSVTTTVAREVVGPDAVHEGRIASGDQFISDADTKKFLVQEFGALCCEMEAAAIAHTCYINEVPFVVVRAISDKADGSAHVDYPLFERQAAQTSASVVKSLCKRLAHE